MSLAHSETTNRSREWREWCEQREQRLRRPHGTLALTGTHWLDEEPQRIDGVPGRWSAAADPVAVLVAATEADGLVLAGKPLVGTAILAPDTAPRPAQVGTLAGGLLLVPIAREGVAALRVYDPQAATRTRFAGIDRFSFNQAAVLLSKFTPYPELRAEPVLNADGKFRNLGLVGEVEFTLGGALHRFAMERNGDGSLQAVFADASSGVDTYRFRFLTAPAPDRHGRTVMDFNRAYLPPCAFVEHYVCPVPPAGNVLPGRVEAGEKLPTELSAEIPTGLPTADGALAPAPDPTVLA